MNVIINYYKVSIDLTSTKPQIKPNNKTGNDSTATLKLILTLHKNGMQFYELGELTATYASFRFFMFASYTVKVGANLKNYCESQ